MINSESENITSIIVDWQSFYKEEFKIDLNFSELKNPVHQTGFDRLLVMPQGLTIEEVFQKCRLHFYTWRFKDISFDALITHNVRDPNWDGTYSIWVRDWVESDKEHQNKSLDNLKEIAGITLMERLIYELKYFKETGKHLDCDTVTLCTGSSSHGRVPHVEWNDRMNVHCYRSADSKDRIRVREVVSLLP